MTNVKKTEDAVSPVVATILLVAIAVGLAAVIAAMAFGMVGNLEGGKMVSLTVDTQKSASGNIIITFAGGADLPALTGLRVTVDGEEASVYNNGYTFPPHVGTIQQYTAAKTGQHRILIVGIFGDYEQILYDRTMNILK